MDTTKEREIIDKQTEKAAIWLKVVRWCLVGPFTFILILIFLAAVAMVVGIYANQ